MGKFGFQGGNWDHTLTDSTRQNINLLAALSKAIPNIVYPDRNVRHVLIQNPK